METNNKKRSVGRPRRFSRDDAREIRRVYKTGDTTIGKLAAQHSVSIGTMHRLINGLGSYASTL